MMRLLIPFLCTAGSLSALDIQIDYRFDGNDFFNTQEGETPLKLWPIFTATSFKTTF